ncbi:MAG: hypothetical protein K2P19_06305 [Kineothrix sp.]|nr:hypothetical protein [Kineothrix sp.]NBI89056.1 hypothetical protein [Lachnospiraceae bacterium]
MMSETYVECLVKKKSNTGMVFLRMLTTIMAVAFVVIGVIVWQALFIGLAMGVAAYFIYLNADLEYEYLYLDKEITIDKVMAKSKRKRVVKYEVERMEILAPIKSWHIDEFKNRTVKTVDYSSGMEKQPDLRYVMYYEGNLKVILEPSMEMVKAIKNIAPRKVFMD